MEVLGQNFGDLLGYLVLEMFIQMEVSMGLLATRVWGLTVSSGLGCGIGEPILSVKDLEEHEKVLSETFRKGRVLPKEGGALILEISHLGKARQQQ